MPVSVKWYNKDKREIYTQFQDPWTVEEFVETRMKWYRLIKSVDYTVPIIIDFSDTFDVPNGILHHFVAIYRTPHPRQGSILVFGLTPLYQKLSTHLFDRTTPFNGQVARVSSIEDALTVCRIIRDQDKVGAN